MKSLESRATSKRRRFTRAVATGKQRSSLAPAMRRMHKERGLGLPLLTKLKRDHPGDPFGQLVKFFQAFRIAAATGRKRQVSYRTEERYFDILRRVLQTLRDELNMKLQNLTELSTRHVCAVTRNWEAKGSSASDLALLNTVLRRFGIWMGKPDLAPLLADLLVDPGRAARSTSLTQPKTWESRGIDPEELFKAMDEQCEVTGLQLRLAWAFGLRLEEQLMFRPAEAHKGNVLVISRGAKGGRVREVKIRSPWEAELVERAKVLAAAHPQKVLAPLPPRRLSQARNHYYYLCRKIGFQGDGFFASTPHGGRHSFAVRQYKLGAGVPAPVLGGEMAPPAIDHATRLQLAEELGHGRPSATTAYIGTVRNMSALARKRMQRLQEIEMQLGTDPELQALTRQACITCFRLVGPAATGDRITAMVTVMCEAAQAIPQHLMDAILARLEALLGQACACIHSRAAGVNALPTFELRALGTGGTGYAGGVASDA
jgi:integrase